MKKTPQRTPEEMEIYRALLRENGAKGGRTTLKRHGKKYFKKTVQNYWDSKKKGE